MTDYSKAEECLRTINQLYELLEQHKAEIAGAMQGEIYEEYKKLIDLEMDSISELRQTVVRYTYI
ncbi:hypothetical protein [Sharpea azabuensis]|uniref:hypothetical protein n=1 Tax=Sharpea azabuensis TaxID=322505 RepID=UPI003D031195